MKYHLACGSKYMDGWVNVDLNPDNKVDLRVDLSKFPWEIESNSASAVLAEHIVEHFDGVDRLIFFHEIFRICKNGAEVTIKVPHHRHPNALGVDDHKLGVFSKSTFNVAFDQTGKRKRFRHVICTINKEVHCLRIDYKFKIKKISTTPEKFGRYVSDRMRDKLSVVFPSWCPEIVCVLEAVKDLKDEDMIYKPYYNEKEKITYWKSATYDYEEPLTPPSPQSTEP